MNIIIIGAGISGLSIAHKLLEKGHAVTVVEARDRIGGRIHTLHDGFTKTVEAGAEFIHGKLPISLALVKDANAEVSLHDGKFYTISKDELEKGDMLDDHWKKLMHELNVVKTDLPMASFLNQHFSGAEYTDLRERVKKFAEGFDIADINRASTIALRDEWKENDEGHQYHINGGYAILVNYLKEKIIQTGGKIMLSEPVQEIQWVAGKVQVITQTGKKLASEKVVITVPLGVLQNGTIRFSPSLPEYDHAFAQMGFGGVIKFLFEFKEPFWESKKSRELKKLAFVFSDAEIPTWWSQLPDRTPLLTGWFSGPKTFDTSHTQAVLYKKAIASLQYIFKVSTQELEAQLVDWHIADWVQDPFTQGAYSYPTVESAAARRVILQPVETTVYFAGEALYEGASMGTVEAALSISLEIAEKI